MNGEPQGLDQFLSAPMPSQSAQAAVAQPPANGEPPGLDQFIEPEVAQAEHGGPLEAAKAAAEGVARGATLGLSDVAETKLGVDPNAIRQRMEANPTLSGAGQMAGGAGLMYATGGLGEGALAAGAEGAAFGAGNVITDKALGDPDLNAQKIAAEIGMGALLGVGLHTAAGGLGSILGKTGYPKDTPADLISSEANGSNLDSELQSSMLEDRQLKSNAPEILDAAKEINAPVSEGMISANPWVQKAEDALVNGAPTYSGIRKAKLYEQGYEAANTALTDMVGAPESDGGLSKAQLGKSLEDSLSTKIDQEQAPISDLYNEIRNHTANTPVSPRSLPRILKNIMDLDPVRLDPDGPAGSLARRMAKNIENVQSVDDIKSLRKILNDGLSTTASNSERYVMGEISDRLKDLEKRTIVSHAESIRDSIADKFSKMPINKALAEEHTWKPQIAQAAQLDSMINKIKQADSMYAPFIKKIQTLSEMLGKKKISGAQGAINFITTDLSPEQLAQRAFQKGDSEMAQFFAKSFPEEWELVKQYQRADLRDSSIFKGAGMDGKLNPRSFVDRVNKLEPEIKELLFSKDELKKLDAVKTYLRSIPKTFNPSGTSGMSAFREFFTHPTGAAIANARDFGIDMYIKAVGGLPDGYRPDAAGVGSELAEKFNKFNAVRNVADRTESRISQAAKSIFSPKAAKGALLSAGAQAIGSYENRTNRIAELANSPEILGQHLTNAVDGMSHTLPGVSQGVQNAMMASVQFLQSKMPQPPQRFMLSPSWQPSSSAKQKFNRYFDAVNNPVGVINDIKTGKLNGESIEALEATHPDLFKEMQTKVLTEMDTEKAKNLTYGVRLCLAKFLGQPLDESMLPNVVISNQMVFNSPDAGPNGMSPKQQRSTQSGLAKLKMASRAKSSIQSSETGGDV